MVTYVLSGFYMTALQQRRAQKWLCARQMQPKPFAPVEPTLFKFESGDAEHLFNHLQRVFITILGVNALTRSESDRQTQSFQTHDLSSQALQIDFHSRTQWVPLSNVMEPGQVEVAAKFPVQPHQYVLIELSRDSLGVVISRDQNIRRLDHVRTEK